MLLIIAGVIVVIWLIGFLAHIAGNLVHALLVVALVVVIVHFLRGGEKKA